MTEQGGVNDTVPPAVKPVARDAGNAVQCEKLAALRLCVMAINRGPGIAKDISLEGPQVVNTEDLPGPAEMPAALSVCNHRL